MHAAKAGSLGWCPGKPVLAVTAKHHTVTAQQNHAVFAQGVNLTPVALLSSLHMHHSFSRGGMFKGPKEGVVEEDYYLAEWTAQERAQVRSNCLPNVRIAQGQGRGWVADNSPC